MPGIKFTFKALRHKPIKLRPESLKREIEDFMIVYSNNVIRELRVYPSPIPLSTYRRTFTLRNSWKIKKINVASGLAYDIVNNTDQGSNANKPRYADFVQGKRQKFIHRGRWATIEDVFDRKLYRSEILQILRKHVAR